jgi:hypothetical protein
MMLRISAKRAITGCMPLCFFLFAEAIRFSSIATDESLCADTVVDASCSDFESSMPGALSRDGLSTLLAASTASMDAAFLELGVTADTISCKDLCLKLVETIPRFTILPAQNDMACYETAARSVVCDVDVSWSSLKKIIRNDTDLKLGPNDAFESDQEELEKESEEARRAMVVNYHTPVLLNRMANLFHIYPFDKVDVDESSSESSLAEVQANTSSETTSERLVYLQQLSQKAVAATNAAVAKTLSLRNKGTFRKWFGVPTDKNPEEKMIEEVLRVLNSAVNVLSTPKFILENDWECGEYTVAFVRPLWPFAKSSGAFLIHICPRFWGHHRDESMKIEALVHEASHHGSGYTEDRCFEKSGLMCAKRAYGRKTCEALAAGPIAYKAINNADNYCYYVSDVINRI